MRLVVMYYGRYQPCTVAHKGVYDTLVDKFGKDNVYFGTSDKTDVDNPFNFEERKKLLLQLTGVEPNHIIKTKKNYNAEEISDQLGLNPEKTIFVVVLGEKDRDRLKTSKYFYPLGKKVETMDKKGYYYIIDNYVAAGGDVINAKSIRDVMRKQHLSPKDYEFIYSRTGLEQEQVQLLRTNMVTESIINEGAAGGRISHPYDDLGMSFGQMFDMIDACLSGSITKEEIPTEKFDGQNMFATVKSGRVLFSRNKTNLKNYGENAMTISDIKNKWKDKDILDQAFTKGCVKMQKTLLTLDDSVLKNIFKNGKNWINFEIVNHVSKNVIDYDNDFLVIHGVSIVDIDGNKISIDRESRKELNSIISNMSDPEVMIPNEINIPEVVDFSKKAGYYKRRIRTLMKKYKCREFDTLGEWLFRYWMSKITSLENKYGTIGGVNNKEDIAKRLAFNDTTVRLSNIKTYINDVAIYDEIRMWVKDNISLNNEAMDKFSTIWLQIGVDVLSNIDTFMMAGSTKSSNKMREDFLNQIDTISASGDENNMKKMRKLLQKIDQLGGQDMIIPSEGIVFKWNGKTYKLTGVFAPLNQIMGINRFK